MRARLVVIALTLTACGGERAASVDFAVEVDGHALCVWAFGDGERLFTERYLREQGATRPPSGSLTFVAGSRVNEEVVVGARVLRGGAVVGEGRRRVRFTEGILPVRVPVVRCAPHAMGGGGSRTLGSLPPSVSRVVLADVDGDGRDELAGWDAEGRLHVLDGDGELASTASELGALSVVAVGDVDGDCAVDLVAVGERDVRVVRSPGLAPSFGPSVAEGARDAAFGAFTGEGGIALATALGLLVAPLRAGPVARFDGAFDALGADDLDGDGFDDVVASGPGGTRYLLGGPSGMREAPGGLPARIAASTGPVVLADLDGDGHADLVVADGARVRVALNRGDGLLEERGALAPLALDTPVVLLRAGDVDGDCRAEVIALTADGTAAVLRGSAGGLVSLEGAWPSARDAGVGDVDGDGVRELLWLTLEGEVQAWQP